MSGLVVLLNLAGAVALLLFATRMVKTGVERAYGAILRRKLRSTMQHPLLAVLAGCGLAVALQSSTAVTLLVASFAGSGIVSGAAGQLAVRGAEVGSALIAKLLAFDLTMLVPLLLISGAFLFMAVDRRGWRQLGRILVGIGLLILSLEMVGDASGPLRESQILPAIIDYFKGDPVTAYLLAALVTWLFHSSIAAILLLATLADRGLVPPEISMVLVLGVNLGSSVIAPILTRNSGPAVRVVPIGNLLMRGLGSLVILIVLLELNPDTGILGGTGGEQIVNAHIIFNLLILIAGVPLSRPIYLLSEKLVAMLAPEDAAPVLDKLSALDEQALARPAQALGNATREIVGMCETLEIMLDHVFELFENYDLRREMALTTLDDRVDIKHQQIKLYLARVNAAELSSEDGLRLQELIGACIKLEQAGDIIVRNMLPLVRKKDANKLTFTAEGWSELTGFHAAVMANARLAFNVLVSRDIESAKQLVEEKDRLRDFEKIVNRNHLDRLRGGTVKSVESSSIHLDTVRDLKQINSLLASMAYPVLEELGILRGSRLRSN